MLKKVANMGRVRFEHADFFASEPPSQGCLIYCDPPFEGTTGYPGIPGFDVRRFWDRCDQLALDGHLVVVSEYSAPSHWEPVLEVRRKKKKRLGHGAKTSLVYAGDAAVGEDQGPSLDIESLWVSAEQLEQQKGLGG